MPLPPAVCTDLKDERISRLRERAGHDLKAHAYQNRKYAVVENGSWAPQAGGLMEEMLSSCKNMTRLGEKVTVLSAVNEGSKDALLALAAAIVADFHS